MGAQPKGRLMPPGVLVWPLQAGTFFCHMYQAWYMWQKNVPGCSGQTNTPGGISLPFGCAPIPGDTQEWAVVNYLNFQLTPKDSLSLRNEYFDDINGQRTGIATRYVGHGIGWTH